MQLHNEKSRPAGNGNGSQTTRISKAKDNGSYPRLQPFHVDALFRRVKTRALKALTKFVALRERRGRA